VTTTKELEDFVRSGIKIETLKEIEGAVLDVIKTAITEIKNVLDDEATTTDQRLKALELLIWIAKAK
jgi:hypothetical protein